MIESAWSGLILETKTREEREALREFTRELRRRFDPPINAARPGLALEVPLHCLLFRFIDRLLLLGSRPPKVQFNYGS